MNENIEDIKKRLNQKMIFIQFDFLFDRDGLLLTAEYFSYSINCQLSVVNENKFIEIDSNGVFTITIKKDIYLPGFGSGAVDVFTSRRVKGEKAIIGFVNTFLKLLPFSIIKHRKGEYQLLDPDGMDYIGE